MLLSQDSLSSEKWDTTRQSLNKLSWSAQSMPRPVLGAVDTGGRWTQPDRGSILSGDGSKGFVSFFKDISASEKLTI